MSEPLEQHFLTYAEEIYSGIAEILGLGDNARLDHIRNNIPNN
jgi:hypothetical protein